MKLEQLIRLGCANAEIRALILEENPDYKDLTEAQMVEAALQGWREAVAEDVPRAQKIEAAVESLLNDIVNAPREVA